MKMRLKKKNRSDKYDINRRRPRYGHEYTKYKMYQYDDEYVYLATPKQNLNLNS